MKEKGIAIKSGFRQPLEPWSLFFCLLISSARIISQLNSSEAEKNGKIHLRIAHIPSIAAEVYHFHKWEENVQYQHIRI